MSILSEYATRQHTQRPALSVCFEVINAAWRGEAWRGEARRGRARRGAAGHGVARRGTARQGEAGRGLFELWNGS